MGIEIFLNHPIIFCYDIPTLIKMKNLIKNSLNKLLNLRGLILIKRYEIDHMKNKYDQLIEESELIFKELVSKDYKLDTERSSLIAKLYGTGVTESLYIIHCLQKSLALKGEVCEFGCASGATSALIANEIKKTTKNFWLFDSFKGLSKPTKKDKLINDIFNLGSMEKYAGTMSYGEPEVISRLNSVSFPKRRTKIIKGFIEETITKKNLPKKVCFAFIDFDLYEPILVALNFLKNRLSVDGFIIVDDYGYFSEGAKLAVDGFIASNQNKFKIELPKKYAGKFCIIEKIK